MGLISSFINAGAQDRTNATNLRIAREQNAYQAQAADLAWERDKEMWNLQNQYNSPAAQMQRLEEAGMNPALSVNNGVSMTSGNANSAPRANVAKVNAPQISAYTGWNLGMNDLFTMLNNLRTTNAQIKNMDANTDLVRARAINENFQNTLNEDTRDYQIDAKRALSRKLLGEADYQDTLNQFSQRTLENRIEMEALKLGLTKDQRDEIQKRTQKLGQDYDIQKYWHDIEKTTGFKYGSQTGDAVNAFVNFINHVLEYFIGNNISGLLGL